MFTAELFETTEQHKRRKLKSLIILPLRENPSTFWDAFFSFYFACAQHVYAHPHRLTCLHAICYKFKPAGVLGEGGEGQIYLFTGGEWVNKMW